MDKIKIMFVNHSVGMGGIETLLLEICRRLNRDIFEPHICIFDPDGQIDKEFHAIGVQVHLIPKKEKIDISLPFKLFRLLKKTGINIIHTNNQGSWLYGGLAAKLAGIPLIHTEHTNVIYHSGNQELWIKIEKLLSVFTFKVTTVAKSVADFMEEKQSIPRKKIQVIENGVDADIYNLSIDIKEKKKELNLNEDEKIVGNVARLTPNKAHDVLIKSFSIVANEISNVKLLIAGDGPLRNDLEKLVAELRLEEKVVFLGVRRDIPELLKSFDVFALSSTREGLPVSLLEAMASSLPVVATDVDGNSELIVHNSTGLLVPSNDIDSLSSALIRILSDKETANLMGERGRSRVDEHYSFRRMIDQYEHVYLQSVGRSTNF